MDEFNFYLKLAKPLALNLPDAKDRTMAARWLKKLCQVDQSDVGTSDKIHVECLKLLIFVMQGNRLSGIFEEPPPAGDIQEILQPLTHQRKKARDMIALAKGRKTSGGSEGLKLIRNDNPPVRRSIAGDMCEYVAVQEIPNFGVHGYYALSTEPLPSWWIPPISSAAGLESKATSPPCFKNTRLSEEEFREAIGEIIRKKSKRDSEASTWNCEQMRHRDKSPPKIIESRRSEIAGVDTRPSWGTSRYIDRLIDESPHLVGDLDLSEADALLHVYRGKRMRKIRNKSRSKGSKADLACAISERRKQVEAKLDMPPCASIPIEAEDFKEQEDAWWETNQARTCFPRKEERQRRCNDPSAESALSISLRGGGSDNSSNSNSSEFSVRAT